MSFRSQPNATLSSCLSSPLLPRTPRGLPRSVLTACLPLRRCRCNARPTGLFAPVLVLVPVDGADLRLGLESHCHTAVRRGMIMIMTPARGSMRVDGFESEPALAGPGRGTELAR